jgi:hypothetical protein
MEKTLGFAINEALENGRQSAMPQFLEMELREKIAQEIELIAISNSTSEIETTVKEIISHCVRVVREIK